MPNYLHTASGTINTSFPWSLRMYSTSAATESAAETTWSSAMAALFGHAGFAALVPTTVILDETSTSTMNSAWKQTTKTSTSAALAGGAAQALPYHVCEIVTWETAQATRYGHGRWYLPCLSPGALATAGYTLSAAAQGDIVAAVNAAIAAWTGTLQPLILHRRGTKSGPGALTTDNIIAGNVPDTFATQRRRADKVVPTRVSLTF